MTPFDVQLMADTSMRMGKSCQKDFASLVDSHGDNFAVSVMINVAADIIVAVMASIDEEEERLRIMAGLAAAIRVNLKNTLSSAEAEDLIARAMNKAKG